MHTESQNTSTKLLAYLGCYVCTDLVIRKDAVAQWGLVQYGVYALSIVWAFFLYREIIARIQGRTSNQARRFPALVVSVLITATISISYGFFLYFKILPNISAFGILFFSPRDFLGSIVSRISLASALMFLVFCLLFYRFIRSSAQNYRRQPRSRWEKGLIILLFLASIPLFQSRTTVSSGALLPEMNALFNLGIATYDQLFDQEHSGRALPRPNRPHLPAVARKAPCNILLILNESLRADHIPALGGPKGLTPFLTTLLAREEGVIFPRFYAVATRTIIALPSWMTGTSPVQSGQALEKAPIFSNYAKQLSGTKTFLIASQPYEPGDVYRFVNDGSWDMIVCAENSGHPFQPATQSISDRFLPAYLDRFLENMQPEETFLGVIHTFGTHHPYYADTNKASLLAPVPVQTRYKEAIRALDANLEQIVTVLQKHGRFDNTIILSTSDHAEAMNEHGYWGHLRTFYNEEARVPGWVLIPRALRRSPAFAEMHKGLLANRNQYLSNIDIMPTVLDILGLSPSPEAPPLLGAPLTRPIQGPRIIRMQNYQDVDNAMFPGTALLYGHYKYILLLENGRKKHHLYDMTSDPHEQHNLWPQAPESLKKAIFSEIEAYPTSREVLTFQPPSPWVDLGDRP
ncbi:sulfatase-like hydrolase/transferase [Desulfoplanes formicivorans]|uniref:Sulfatase N-terminal domain-containing protein n=1 Tax=Desulfoplanes formicivorans TaxID=1592317 RepID=A0A194ADS7_9BACT|nr:sulfatase-like hydrolase/transferase [Desulfoplanes formicivorans]GAU07493.1 hypothetical protein DPF_0177 [Desulfoplanes formicivorans]